MAKKIVSRVIIVSGVGEQSVEAQEALIDAAGVSEGFNERNAAGATDALTREALENGGRDNVTCIVVDMFLSLS